MPNCTQHAGGRLSRAQESRQIEAASDGHYEAPAQLASQLLVLVTQVANTMPTRFSKTRKHRGHVSAGHGRVGKHRKHPGGRGLAGGQHHHRTNFDKYHYGYFGKVGMRHFHKNKAALWRPVVNCDKLASLIPEAQRKGLSTDSAVVPVVDTLAAGYGKVLAKGRLPAFPIILKARYVSRRAEQKIVEAGGVVSIVA
ncbi:hypothetical protein MVLG_02238 [Microbotryum lychnidis-dioicae p1A1 Lamole]|uniref:Large ribosomal subunit protein uL15/eL18 domain-containing protein n=1 Tax=Microbotryum lychnidis-dioicae (strain p1A1 Lamole / MvSl-1064) TaxID=683840 RepID=U5H4K0_USTV1|nr:hypothetical protein MVLG_02238 [Microbotryum lychnidis-dioicae p1A1 Lamole]|eukprot:KDE07569.1 hypothetical protein MVLG_02238 [Microbotryum lychnidis-dioicae p1A1 Lamole]